MQTCEKCGANLALVGRAHRCRPKVARRVETKALPPPVSTVDAEFSVVEPPLALPPPAKPEGAQRKKRGRPVQGSVPYAQRRQAQQREYMAGYMREYREGKRRRS
jgi:hypothetical protein